VEVNEGECRFPVCAPFCASPIIFSHTIQIREFVLFFTEFLNSFFIAVLHATRVCTHFHGKFEDTMLVWFEEGNTAESATVFYLRETILQKHGPKQLKIAA
jgi:hypothetical protein